MNFPEKLRKIRLKRGLSQGDLAKAVGASLRTIQNYESGSRIPKNFDTYAKLAEALGVLEEDLRDDTTDFLTNVGEQYGSVGQRQAKEFIEEFRVMCAGGKYDEDDLDFIMEALQNTYWETKRYNRRFVNKRFLNDPDEGSGQNS